MRTPSKDRLKETTMHAIVEQMGFYGITTDDLTEYMSRVPRVKERVIGHRTHNAREQKRVEALNKVRESKVKTTTKITSTGETK